MTRERLISLLSASLDATPDLIGGGALLCHTPSVAPLAYLHRVYPVVAPENFINLATMIGRSVPAAYRDFLLSVGNGASLFQLSLYGLIGQVNRSPTDPLGQPISLRYGNVNDRPNGLDDGAFAIGGMTGWSSRGCLIMAASGEVRLVHPIDGHDVAARWASLDAMLKGEIARCSPLYDRAGRLVAPHAEVMHPGGRKWETKVEP